MLAVEGFEDILAEVHPGGRREAILHALSLDCNLARNDKDKKPVGASSCGVVRGAVPSTNMKIIGYQEFQLYQLWGIACILTGDLESHPYRSVAKPAEAELARSLRRQIDDWLTAGEWPGDEAFEATNKAVVDLHAELFNRKVRR